MKRIFLTQYNTLSRVNFRTTCPTSWLNIYVATPDIFRGVFGWKIKVFLDLLQWGCPRLSLNGHRLCRIDYTVWSFKTPVKTFANCVPLAEKCRLINASVICINRFWQTKMDLSCWIDVGDNMMATEEWFWWFFSVSNRSQSSKSCHHQSSFPIYVTNIDVAVSIDSNP